MGTFGAQIAERFLAGCGLDADAMGINREPYQRPEQEPINVQGELSQQSAGLASHDDMSSAEPSDADTLAGTRCVSIL
jgi:hypothetical protein